jgi:hypothetical protein
MDRRKNRQEEKESRKPERTESPKDELGKAGNVAEKTGNSLNQFCRLLSGFRLFGIS